MHSTLALDTAVLEVQTPLTKDFCLTLESACHPEPQGMEGYQERADQVMHATKMAHALVQCVPPLPACHPGSQQPVPQALWEDLGQKEKVSCIKDSEL